MKLFWLLMRTKKSSKLERAVLPFLFFLFRRQAFVVWLISIVAALLDEEPAFLFLLQLTEQQHQFEASCEGGCQRAKVWQQRGVCCLFPRFWAFCGHLGQHAGLLGAWLPFLLRRT